jgi:AcrB/AcrD/AcrF family
MFVDLLAVGPPAGRPVQYRLSRPDIQRVKELARQLAALVGEHSLVSDIDFNWNEPAWVVKVDARQDKARQLGVTSQDEGLNDIVGGSSITQVRDAIYLIDVVGRARAAERHSVETLRTCNCRARTASPCRSLLSRVICAPSTTPQRAPTLLLEATRLVPIPSSLGSCECLLIKARAAADQLRVDYCVVLTILHKSIARGFASGGLNCWTSLSMRG